MYFVSVGNQNNRFSLFRRSFRMVLIFPFNRRFQTRESLETFFTMISGHTKCRFNSFAMERKHTLIQCDRYFCLK